MATVAIASGRLSRAPLRHTAPILLVAPLALYMAAFYALPLASMLLRSIADPTWTMENYRRLAGDAVFLHVFGTTLRTALIVTLGALAFGYPVALALSRLRQGAATLVLIIVLLPFWTSVLVRSYAWMVLLGRKGLVNEALIATGLIDAPLKLLNTPFAVHIAMIHILLPYMILPIASVLRQIDGALLRAAAGLGAPPWRRVPSGGAAAVDTRRRGGSTARVCPVTRLLHHARAGRWAARSHALDADSAAG